MKKLLYTVMGLIIVTSSLDAQTTDSQFLNAIQKLGTASNVRTYEQLANTFVAVSNRQPNNWLPLYYAALCNSRIGLLYRNDGNLIEPYLKKADAQIRKAVSLLDTAVQKKELSEVYCVFSMISRANAFMSGTGYSPAASQYIALARQTNPSNPRALYLEASEKYHTPRIFGGDKNKARQYLQLAEKQLSTQQVSRSYPSWGSREVQEILEK